MPVFTAVPRAGSGSARRELTSINVSLGCEKVLLIQIGLSKSLTRANVFAKYYFPR
jgi:hypothetical protein